MTKYLLVTPIDAVRFEKGGNESDVTALIKRGRPTSRWSNTEGFLHVYNDGPDLRINGGDWVVELGPGLTVLADDVFRELFERVA